MGERKVLNKYYPPDFDPSKIPRRRQPKNQQMKVRMMLPMSIRCSTCGTYIYKGTKFNSRKEDAVGETYLGIQIYRFYFKCTKCSAEITYKTDPANSDYVVESGASRNFEPWRSEDEEIEKEKRKRDAEEMGDAMKSLENRALDSKQDMDILASLEEMRSMKSRHATVTSEVMLEALRQAAEKEEDKIKEEDEEIIRSIFHGQRNIIRRINDDEDDDDDNDEGQCKMVQDPALDGKPTNLLAKTSTFKSNTKGGSSEMDASVLQRPRSLTVSIVKRARQGEKNQTLEFSAPEGSTVQAKDNLGDQSNVPKASDANIGLQSLCQNYGSDESE